MFNAYKRFFAFAGKQKKTWYKGMGYELLRSIFEAIQFIALLVVLRALVEQNVTGETALAALGVMLVSVTGAAVFWYLAHNSEGQANYHMCEEKRIRIGERKLSGVTGIESIDCGWGGIVVTLAYPFPGREIADFKSHSGNRNDIAAFSIFFNDFNFCGKNCIVDYKRISFFIF